MSKREIDRAYRLVANAARTLTVAARVLDGAGKRDEARRLRDAAYTAAMAVGDARS